MANHFLSEILTYETPTLLGTIYQRHEKMFLVGTPSSLIETGACFAKHKSGVVKPYL
jgi:hypothetical protein